MNEAGNQWSEGDSEIFIDLAEIFVPGRREQMDALLDLIPARDDERFTVVELASGEGALAQAVLKRFHACQYVALDGSEVMRQHMGEKLRQFGDRLEIRPFEWTQQDWRDNLPRPLRCVVSSLSVHHLFDEEKQQLFRELFDHLEPGGALLVADIIEPANRQIADLFAKQYDEIVRKQSIQIRGDLRGFEQFQQLKWNYFRYDYLVEGTNDHPSCLSDQLLWLRGAGFSMVDCFWMQAGHAVYGGYK
ncbi:MAG TPA: class I SAM-dependent methyltransferase [Ktedonobacteraceae bacterium]|nr:class I SAM-dependent methyltransferase [Ktedonobacteraceae bacterium]